MWWEYIAALVSLQNDAEMETEHRISVEVLKPDFAFFSFLIFIRWVFIFHSFYFHRSLPQLCDSFKSIALVRSPFFVVHSDENGILTLFSSRYPSMDSFHSFSTSIFSSLLLICFGYLSMIQMSILWRKYNNKRWAKETHKHTSTFTTISSSLQIRKPNKYGEQSNGFHLAFQEKKYVNDATQRFGKVKNYCVFRHRTPKMGFDENFLKCKAIKLYQAIDRISVSFSSLQ